MAASSLARADWEALLQAPPDAAEAVGMRIRSAIVEVLASPRWRAACDEGRRTLDWSRAASLLAATDLAAMLPLSSPAQLPQTVRVVQSLAVTDEVQLAFLQVRAFVVAVCAAV